MPAHEERDRLAGDGEANPQSMHRQPRHRIAEPSSWPWLPTQRHGHLERHPWCVECGAVGAVGAERALDLGGLLNVVARLDRRLREHGQRMTEAQRRLIVKRLVAVHADDVFGLTREAQERLLAEIAGGYLGMQPSAVITYLHAH